MGKSISNSIADVCPVATCPANCQYGHTYKTLTNGCQTCECCKYYMYTCSAGDITPLYSHVDSYVIYHIIIYIIYFTTLETLEHWTLENLHDITFPDFAENVIYCVHICLIYRYLPCSHLSG